MCIWLATSRSVPARAEVYSDDVKRLPIASTTKRQSEAGQIQLGDNLFLHLLEVRPLAGGGFPMDTLLFYDLWLGDQNLQQLKILDVIRYPNFSLPGFFLPSTLSTIFHGSCRKPHGGAGLPGNSNGDGLTLADDLLAESFADLQQRPALLFLTGDQIYGDDVAGALLLALSNLGQRLTGWQELIPEVGDSSTIPLYGRKEVLKKIDCGFTSEKSDNHLLTFGEYAAMYLFTWGGVSLKLPAWQEVQDMFAGGRRSKYNKLKKKYEQEYQQLERFSATLPKVRRLLANVPCYMIFDDHDVTDDWNLNRSWYRNVSDSACSRRIVSNALAAYWAFQGWGNSPERFSPEFVRTVTQHLRAQKIDGESARQFDDALWNTRWGYAVATDPPVVVLDTRTQRGFDSRFRPPQLMNTEGCRWLKKTWEALRTQSNQREETPPLIVVSATPVYGFEPVEMLQKIMVAFGIKPFVVDFESWIANRHGFGLFLRTLCNEHKPKWCLFLSGDVHYSFTTRAQFEDGGRKLKVWQATSSPLHNESHGVEILEELSRVSKRIERRFDWRDEQAVSLRYKLFRPLFDVAIRWNLKIFDNQTWPIWKDQVEGIAIAQSNKLVTKGNNVGVIRFQNGEPKIHELRMPDKVVTFQLT